MRNEARRRLGSPTTRARATVLCLAALSAACGSQTVAMDSGTGNDGSSDGTGALDAASGGPCPSALPSAGASCPTAGLVCEYGSDPRRACHSLATCTSGTWAITSPNCAPQSVTCPATRDAAQGAACMPMDAVCGYGDLVCTCTNCTSGPVTQCMGAPTWHCESPNSNAQCPAGLPNLGRPCSPDGTICTYACGPGNGRTCRGGGWTASDGGPCPVSTRRAKRDIEYLSSERVDALARDVIATHLATYEYIDPALAGRRRLGFIIEDQPRSFAVDPERSQVDLYGFTSMLVASVQSQQREIERLEARIRTLEAPRAATRRTRTRHD